MSYRKPEDVEPCGTRAAYQRHIRHGEVPCDACMGANRLFTERYRRPKPVRLTHSTPWATREQRIHGLLGELIRTLAQLYEEQAA